MRRLFRSGGKRKGLAALLVLSVFFSPARPAQAESYDPGRLGSICISLTDLGTDREDVLFELYKVGTLKRAVIISGCWMRLWLGQEWT